MGSNAVSQNAVSTVLGYLLSKGFFNPSSPNLPQNISILAEGNDANQGSMSTAAQVITSAKQAATLYGYGSPIYTIARILFPSTGSGVTIPVTVYPQLAADGAAAKVITITPTGNATAAGTIFLNICGRENVDGGSYAVNIAVDDTPTIQCNKMRAAVAAVLGAPVLGSGTTTAIFTTKWSGLTANDVNIVIDLNNTNVGTTYAVVNTTAGSGTPSTTGSGNGTALFGNAWNTLVINSYGLVSATMTELEAYNGVPDPTTPTGQYSGTIMRPMWALSGTTLDDPTSITKAGVRPNNVTIVPCVAPLSAGMPFEAAANVAYILANVFQNTPQSDIIGLSYPDMPPPPIGSIPQMNTQSFREYCVENGCSTVDYIDGATGNGVYVIKDLVTTYNLAGEYPPFYRWVRDLNVHFNYKFGYYLKEQQDLVGKTLVDNAATVTADNVIKPNMWKAIVTAYNKDCESRALIVNADENSASINVTINGGNPNRLDTTQNIQISGIVRIAATTVNAGFNFTN